MTEGNKIAVPTAGLTTPEVGTFASQVSPDALQKLFDSDPEQLNDRDIEIIVAELRKQRARFDLDEQAKAMKEKKPKGKKAKALSADESKQLSLTDLGL